jgi:hypothetical protein
MARSFAPIIRAANSTLIANGDLRAVGDFFNPDYVAHLPDGDRILGRIAEDWVVTDLAERLLRARKRSGTRTRR